MTGTRRLTRSTSNKMIAGVCGGLAEYLDLDVTLVRAGYVLLSLLMTGFPGVLIYIILMFVLPED